MKKLFILCFALLCGITVVSVNAQSVVFVSQTDHGQSLSVANSIPTKAADKKLSHFLTRENLAAPEKLYVNGFSAIRAIKQAEKQYAKKHKQYTANIEDLKLTFQNMYEQFYTNNTSRIYLDNGFYYVLTDKLVAVYFDNVSEAAQLYHLDFYFDGTQQCIAKISAAKTTCEKLGGTNPRANSRIQNWTIYDLPKNFLE